MACEDAGDCSPPCSGCMIGSECVEPGMAQPGNPCRVCDPARQVTSWSDRQGSCDDGMFCTVDDACQEGRCAGVERACDDRIACNGASECDEAADRCSPETNLCPAGMSCDAVSGQCVSRCEECGIAGICIPNGGSAPGNACLICDTAQSTSAYTVTVGRVCGATPDECSQQDTCDAAGVCIPNHLPEGTPCGSPAGDACDPSDTCDGSGICTERVLSDSSACDDGQYCTANDACLGGVCVSGPARDCGPLEACSEASRACDCRGCVIDGACVESGTRHATNPCLVCDRARNVAGFSAAVGEACGAGPTVCSGQDTCDAAGNCAPNHLGTSAACGDSSSSACDLPDGCDGNGGCDSRARAEGMACDDGNSCTRLDRCQAGQCVGRLLLDCVDLR